MTEGILKTASEAMAECILEISYFIDSFSCRFGLTVAPCPARCCAIRIFKDFLTTWGTSSLQDADSGVPDSLLHELVVVVRVALLGCCAMRVGESF